jgi:hypothetical protein
MVSPASSKGHICSLKNALFIVLIVLSAVLGRKKDSQPFGNSDLVWSKGRIRGPEARRLDIDQHASDRKRRKDSKYTFGCPGSRGQPGHNDLLQEG